MGKGIKRSQSFSWSQLSNKSQRHAATPATTKSLSAIVKRLIPEKKGHDTVCDTGPIVATTTTAVDAFQLNSIQVGAAEYQRVGKKVQLASLRIKGNVYTVFDTAALATVGTCVRMVVLWDKQQSAGLNFDQIFGHTNNIGTEACHVQDSIKYDQRERFSILRDKTFVMNPPTGIAGLGASTCAVNDVFDEYIKLNGKETYFDATANPSGISDISQGTLLVFFRCSSVTNSSSYISNCTARLRYHD